jgi:hypothetical protein
MARRALARLSTALASIPLPGDYSRIALAAQRGGMGDLPQAAGTGCRRRATMTDDNNDKAGFYTITQQLEDIEHGRAKADLTFIAHQNEQMLDKLDDLVREVRDEVGGLRRDVQFIGLVAAVSRLRTQKRFRPPWKNIR